MKSSTKQSRWHRIQSIINNALLIVMPGYSRPLSSLQEISMYSANIHLSPGGIENCLFVGHLSCALSEERESLEREAAGCGRLCPWNSYQLNPFSGGLDTPVGAPLPASGSSGVPGPRRPVKTEAKRVKMTGRERQVQNIGWGRRGDRGGQWKTRCRVTGVKDREWYWGSKERQFQTQTLITKKLDSDTDSQLMSLFQHYFPKQEEKHSGLT